MGDLRDQLKKAKLLSEKRSRQLAHEERVHRKEVGREGLEQEQEARREEVERLQAQERETQRATQQELDEQRRVAAEQAACADILRDAVRPAKRGGARWYFQLEDGSLPWLEVDEALRFQLQSGAYWVVRTGPVGSHVYGLLPVVQAQRVMATMPDVVVWAPGGVPKRR